MISRSKTPKAGTVKLLPRDRVVQVTFLVSLPNAATPEDVQEWVSHNLGRGALRADNVLAPYPLEPAADPDLADTQTRLRREETRLSNGDLRITRTLSRDSLP